MRRNESSSLATWRLKHAGAMIVAAVLWYATHAAAQDVGFDEPFDHPLQLGWPNIGTHDATYGPDALRWTSATRVLAIQPLGRNWDMIVDTEGGPTYVSQRQSVGDVDFVLFDGNANGFDQRPTPPTSATIYHNGAAGGFFYSNYVTATPFDVWDEKNGHADFRMTNSDLVQAKTLYLRAGTAYRFDIDRHSATQTGFGSLMRTDPETRIQPRSQALAEFSWGGEQHDDFVFVPEEGLHTLVVVQLNGDAYGLATPRNSVVITRGDAQLKDNDNTVRINVSAE